MLAGTTALGYYVGRPPLSPDDHQPAAFGNGLSICFDGRLDNREELIDALHAELDTKPADNPDWRLAIACYQKFGDSFAARLNGDYALAVFDAARQQLVLARDPMGIRPLYFWASDRLAIAASEIKAILAHPAVASRPDEEALADLLMGGDPNEQRRTLFRGVQRMLPGRTVIIGAQALREDVHWDFDPSRQLRYRTTVEYAEALRELFERAVRRRLRSPAPVAVSVSGGLDSSAILCEAALLRRSNAALAPAYGISRLYPEASRADERAYLAAIEEKYGVAIQRLPASPIRLVHGDEWLQCSEFPVYPGSDVLELLARARELSCATLLEGHYGDQLLWSPAHIHDLMRRLRWIEASRALLSMAESMRDASPAELRRDLLLSFIRDLVPDRLMRPFRALRRLASPDRFPKWYSAAFREIAYRRSQQQRRPGGSFANKHSEHCYRMARSVPIARAFEESNKLAARHGLDVAYPFADRDLIAFVMAIPAAVLNLGGAYKGLFREAMTGILPDSIRARSWKADFTLLESNAAAELSRSGPSAYLGADLMAVKYGYVNAGALTEEFPRLRARLTGESWLPAKQMNELLALERWMGVFFARRPPAEPESSPSD